MNTTPKYPEHEKMHEARARGSEEIGAFLDWLRSGETSYVLAEWEKLRACEAESWDTLQGMPRWRCIDGRIMKGPEYEEDLEECEVCDGAGTYVPEHPDLLPAHVSIETLLAEYFGVDLDKLDDEKRAMLNAIQKANSET